MPNCSSRGCSEPAKRGCRKMCGVHYRRKVRLRVFGYRDKTKAVEHIKALRVLGWTYRQIDEAAGVAVGQGWSIERGKQPRVWCDTEQRILSVPLAPASSRRGFESIGTVRRLQALQCLGWSVKEIAARVGSPEATIRTLKGRKRFSTSLARQIARVYEEMSMTPGPSRWSPSSARKAGYAPPIAWDEGAIDDPKARPRGVKARRVA